MEKYKKMKKDELINELAKLEKRLSERGVEVYNIKKGMDKLQCELEIAESQARKVERTLDKVHASVFVMRENHIHHHETKVVDDENRFGIVKRDEIEIPVYTDVGRQLSALIQIMESWRDA